MTGLKKTLMQIKMKKIAIIIFLFTAVIIADDSPVIEIYSGWSLYPYSPYYYPYSPRYYAPLYHHSYRRGPLHSYNYPYYSNWYDYGYPYYYPYSGFYFQNNSLILELNPKKILDLPKQNSLPFLPGSAPLSLRSEDDPSLQDERLKRFLSTNSNTNKNLGTLSSRSAQRSKDPKQTRTSNVEL